MRISYISTWKALKTSCDSLKKLSVERTFTTRLKSYTDQQAEFSKIPEEYYGADIWKYFYEDLDTDLSNDTLTKNFLFILTDGYPIVGKDLSKLKTVKEDYPELQIVLLEVSPRDKDMEWDNIMEMWKSWFNSMQVGDYTFIKRKAISKEIEQVKEIISN